MDQFDGYILGNILASAGSWKTKDGTSTVAAWNASNKLWRETLSRPHNLAVLLAESNGIPSALSRSVIKGDCELVDCVLELERSGRYHSYHNDHMSDTLIEDVLSNPELLRATRLLDAPKLLSVELDRRDDCNAAKIGTAANALRHFSDTLCELFAEPMFFFHHAHNADETRLLVALLPKDAPNIDYLGLLFDSTIRAAGFGDAELVRTVFDAHFDKFLGKYNIFNVFDNAVEHGHADTALSVLEFPGVLDDADVCSSASFCVYRDDAIVPSSPRGDAVVRRLYRAGTARGWTPEANNEDNTFFEYLAGGRQRVVLELAAEAGHETVVRRIVEGGAWDADEERLCIGRAMAAAAARGHAGIVGVLRERLATLALISLSVHAAPFVP